MKKFNVLTVILTVLLLSSFLAKGLHASQPIGAGNKWKIISVTGPKTCKLNAKELTFKIKIKNMGDVTSAREKITLGVTHEDTWDILNKEFWTPQIDAGKTTSFSVVVNVNNFANSTGNKTTSVSFECVCAAGTTSITKNFTIKVWDGSTR
jgi:hypothetical protein